MLNNLVKNFKELNTEATIRPRASEAYSKLTAFAPTIQWVEDTRTALLRLSITLRMQDYNKASEDSETILRMFRLIEKDVRIMRDNNIQPSIINEAIVETEFAFDRLIEVINKYLEK